ncbi:hypothetical protein MKJ04_14220 [Pontibacter sp. E15-1]|uniref:hypothetical protein n=1 Tax=Pontibacter sp. E15-1 TaxID=2919918 RepID=UPI001F4F24BD|nr:hypothetical protein [Pontibacter sp. E15-1]MCJ8165999.1 hypothetical protein [Pontibacter sp. E15-1]
MKKIFLLPILFLMLLTSCKELENIEPLSEQIQGKWNSVKETRQYYNEENQELHVTNYDYHRYWEFMADSTFFNKWHPNSAGSKMRYSVYPQDGKNYIELKVSLHNLFEVKILGDRMTWVGKFMDQIYYEDNEDRTLVRAHHEIYTIEFERE